MNLCHCDSFQVKTTSLDHDDNDQQNIPKYQDGNENHGDVYRNKFSAICLCCIFGQCWIANRSWAIAKKDVIKVVSMKYLLGSHLRDNQQTLLNQLTCQTSLIQLTHSIKSIDINKIFFSWLAKISVFGHIWASQWHVKTFAASVIAVVHIFFFKYLNRQFTFLLKLVKKMEGA